MSTNPLLGVASAFLRDSAMYECDQCLLIFVSLNWVSKERYTRRTLKVITRSNIIIAQSKAGRIEATAPKRSLAKMPPVVNLLPYIISSIARWGALLRLGYGFVVVFLRHQEFRPNDGDGVDSQHDPADRAQYP